VKSLITSAKKSSPSFGGVCVSARAKKAEGSNKAPASDKKPPTKMATLTPFWLWTFRVEILIVLGTVFYWTFFHLNYFRNMFGQQDFKAREFFLLLQGGVTIFCCYVYFYARVLFDMKHFHFETFTKLQEAMAIGDVLVLVLSFLFQDVFSQGSAPHFIAMIVMAIVWGGARVVFLSMSSS